MTMIPPKIKKLPRLHKPQNDQEIQKYINESLTEEIIRRYEEQLLSVMKIRYEKYPTERNDEEWLDFTNHVCRRRCQREHENNDNDSSKNQEASKTT